MRHLVERGGSWTELGSVHLTFELPIDKVQP